MNVETLDQLMDYKCVERKVPIIGTHLYEFRTAEILDDLKSKQSPLLEQAEELQNQRSDKLEKRDAIFSLVATATITAGTAAYYML